MKNKKIILLFVLMLLFAKFALLPQIKIFLDLQNKITSDSATINLLAARIQNTKNYQTNLPRLGQFLSSNFSKNKITYSSQIQNEQLQVNLQTADAELALKTLAETQNQQPINIEKLEIMANENEYEINLKFKN